MAPGTHFDSIFHWNYVIFNKFLWISDWFCLAFSDVSGGLAERVYNRLQWFLSWTRPEWTQPAWTQPPWTQPASVYHTNIVSVDEMYFFLFCQREALDMVYRSRWSWRKKSLRTELALTTPNHWPKPCYIKLTKARYACELKIYEHDYVSLCIGTPDSIYWDR